MLDNQEMYRLLYLCFFFSRNVFLFTTRHKSCIINIVQGDNLSVITVGDHNEEDLNTYQQAAGNAVIKLSKTTDFWILLLTGTQVLPIISLIDIPQRRSDEEVSIKIHSSYPVFIDVLGMQRAPTETHSHTHASLI